MNKLEKYFLKDVLNKKSKTVGMEVETQFFDFGGLPISTKTSQKIFEGLLDRGWRVIGRKSELITCIESDGNTFSYELGRHNIELSTKVSNSEQILFVAQDCLGDLYRVAYSFGAKPLFEPVYNKNEDLLVIPDSRDAVWLELDGRTNLTPLARTSSVQFTISVDPGEAIAILNRFGEKINMFLGDYPQEVIWKKYIKESLAGYRPDRYGGPLFFESLGDYCEKLSKNDVVVGTKLVPFSEVDELDTSLFLRSIWWYFRLKRYGTDLCVEVRPMARRTDDYFKTYLDRVLEIVEG